MIKNIKTILIAIFLLLFFSGNVNAYTVGAPPTMLPPAYSSYAPNSAAADQGVTSTAYVTLKNLVDAIGATDQATIILSHSGATAQTTYTLTTNESVPANQMLYFENGAIIDGAGTLTLDSPEQIIANPRQEIFGSSITVSFTNPGKVYPQWWNGNAGDGSTDCGPAIISASNAIQNSGGGVLKFPSGDYLVMETGTAYTILKAFTSIDGLQIIGDAAKITVDTTRTFTSPYGYLWTFTDCTNVIIDGLEIEGPAQAAADHGSKGVESFRFIDDCQNLTIGTLKVKNMVSAVIISKATGATATETKGVDIQNLTIDGVGYGLNCQFTGNNVKANITVINGGHRTYLVYGVHNHDIFIKGADFYAADVVLKSYSGYGCQDIRLKYYNHDAEQASGNAGGFVYIEWGDQTPGIFRNIYLDLDLYWSGTNDPYDGVRIAKYEDDGTTPDTSDRGHTLENLVITGYMEGASEQATGHPIHWYSLNTWSTGDYLRNIHFKDLRFNGTRLPYMELGALVDHLTFTNVTSDVDLTINDPPVQGHIHYYNTKFGNVESSYGRRVASYNANTTLNRAYEGIFSNKGSGGVVIHTLFPALVDDSVIFIESAAQEYRIDPSGTEVIRGGGAGKYLSLSAGESVHLHCMTVGIWEIVSYYGIPTFE